MLRNQQQNQQQRQLQQQVRQTYVSQNPDICSILDGEVGSFRVLGGVLPVYNAQCEEGHSIKSFIPVGQEYIWVIQPTQASDEAQIPEGDRARGLVGAR
jgi:hypothetical protein